LKEFEELVMCLKIQVSLEMLLMMTFLSLLPSLIRTFLWDEKIITSITKIYLEVLEVSRKRYTY